MDRNSKPSKTLSESWQPKLFTDVPTPPSTRYQGSKQKLVNWIIDCLEGLKYNSVLDAFGGTGAISYRMKALERAVTYNDYLRFNQLIGKALIENSSMRLSNAGVEYVLNSHRGCNYESFISDTFSGIYFTDDENEWLDIAAQNIPRLENEYEQAIAYFALFQSCIAKRPYNLFHRKNLYIRTADVTRTFGNKSTWDKPFSAHFRKFVAEANTAVFASCAPCNSVCYDAAEVPGEFDLVYIDTPYISKKGVGVDYRDFYHFLEGLADYSNWPQLIDHRRKHKPLIRASSPWNSPTHCYKAFTELFRRFEDSILVVSYRSDGIPAEDELVRLMATVKPDVQRMDFGHYKYVLSTNGNSKETLIIGV